MNPRRILLLLAICCLAAAPAMAAPGCSDCNCGLPCSTQCKLPNGQWSMCFIGPACKERCELGGQTASTSTLSKEAFLESLAEPASR